MNHKPFLLLQCILMILMNACLFAGPRELEIVEPTATRMVAILSKPPTATNFPRIGTATPISPTPTPTITPSPTPSDGPMFDDETLEELMVGTIRSIGVNATLAIVDNRATGGERIAEVVIISKYNIAESNLLLKLFVLEVGNALRSIRAFTQGDLNADLDGLSLTVVDQDEAVLGTITAPLSVVTDYLEGKITVDEALAVLEPTGVFETFVRTR